MIQEVRQDIVSSGEIFLLIIGYGMLIFCTYVSKDTIVPFVTNIKKVMVWIFVSGIVLWLGMQYTAVPAWLGQESYETLEHVEGICDCKRTAKMDIFSYYIYNKKGKLLAADSAVAGAAGIGKLHGEHVSVWHKKVFGNQKYVARGYIYEIAVEGKTIFTVEETNKQVMHTNLTSTLAIYAWIIYVLLFITDIMIELAKEIISRFRKLCRL